MIAVNEHWKITYCNPIGAKFLHAHLENVLDHDFRELGKAAFCHILERCFAEGVVLNDTITLKSRGAKQFLEVVAAPKKDGEGVILVIQDKSDQHKLMEMRRDFVANASHELRTPITIIRGFAETLHDNPNLPAETSCGITEKIVRNCERMGHLIQDLLALSDVENLPESRIQECRLGDMVKDVCQMIHEAYSDAKIEIVVEKNQKLSFQGDQKLVEMAISNLLVNAVKYSPVLRISKCG